jgi:hypothetical protein
MGKIEKQTLIQGAFMEKLTQIHQIPKITNHHFSDKFQWVTKYIEFFFGNFHIWYIARFGPSPLWLHHKIGNENTVNLASFASSLFCTWYQ